MGQDKERNFFSLAPLFLFLLFLQSLPLVPERHPIELRYRSFSTEEGLSSDLSQALFVDRLGFLWIATYDGLNCYDGYSFRKYHHLPGDRNSLSHDHILLMHDDSLGRMWLLTETGLDILDPHTGRVTRLGKPLELWGTQIIGIEDTRNGEMWLGTETNKLLRLDSGSGRMLPLPELLGSGLCPKTKIYLALFCEDDKGNLWFGSSDCGAFRFSPASGRLDHFRSGGGKGRELLGDFVYDISQDENGFIWIANSTGLNRFDPATETIRSFPLPGSKGLPDFYFDKMLILADPCGWIWLATNKGIYLFDQREEKYGEPLRLRSEFGNSSMSNGIFFMASDGAGNIWTDNFGSGISRFNPRVNRIQQVGSDLEPQLQFLTMWVNSLFEDHSGTLWIGTRQDGLISYDPATNKLVRHGIPPFSPSGYQLAKSVSTICEASNGDIWFAHGGNFYRYERLAKEFHRVGILPEFDRHSLIGRRFGSIQREEPNIFWICCQDQGIYRIDEALTTCTLFKWEEIGPSGLSPRGQKGLFLDHSRTLWVYSDNGLHRRNPASGGFSQFLPGMRVTAVTEDRNGNLWVIADKQIRLMNRLHGTFREFPGSIGLKRSLVEDQDGFIWGGTNSGLARFDPHSGSFRYFDANDGISIGDPCGIRCRDGRLVFGGRRGLILFDPREVARINTKIPPIFFTAFHVSDREVPLHKAFSQRDQSKETGRVTLRPGDRMLSVEFAALDFSAPEKNQYAFRIEEQGDAWNDLGTRRQLTFSNLRVGSHTLRVKGSNNDGVWNEKGVALQIVVLPHFWQTWWFKALCLLLLAGIVFAIVAVCRTISSLRKIAKPPNLDEIFLKHKISHREQEILHLVIQGKSNREMENELFISIPTVKRHLANIYEKIGVSSRLQLINFLQGRKPRY